MRNVALGAVVRVARSACAALGVTLFMSLVALAGTASTLRVPGAEIITTLDPARADTAAALSFSYGLFDQLYAYDLLAVPVRLRPLAAAGLPEVSNDGLEYTVRIRPGIQFSPHPAFGGGTRELTATDFAYSIKRLVDPALRSPSLYLIDGLIEGLNEAAAAAARDKRPFDYDAPIPGLTAVDRYTLRIRLTRREQTFAFLLAHPALSAVPREVVAAEGDAFGEKPVGSGPFLMRTYVPRSKLVVERNPRYRGVAWSELATPKPSDADLARRMQNKKLPLVDRIEATAIVEPSALILSLERGEIDAFATPFGDLALDGDKLKPRLRQAGVQLVLAPDLSSTFLWFNMRDPVVGGTTLTQVALRRAIAMAFDDRQFIVAFAKGNGSIRQHPIPPVYSGFDPDYRNPNPFDPAAANALLDRMGFRRGADGWRVNPDGSPLRVTMIRYATSTGQQMAEFMKRSFDRIGVRIEFEAMAMADRMKRLETCTYQITTMDWGYDVPDGSNLYTTFSSRAIGSVNLGCFADSQFDADLKRLRNEPIGPTRTPIYRALQARIDAIMPARLLPATDLLLLSGPRIHGMAAHPIFALPIYFLDVEEDRAPRRSP
jgi:ABC-type transport system substrate-binding protein